MEAADREEAGEARDLEKADEGPAARQTQRDGAPSLLDDTQTQILRALLHGKETKDILKAHQLMPSLVTDAINEALFDAIGDNVLSWDDHAISIVEDYKEDIRRMIGETSDE